MIKELVQFVDSISDIKDVGLKPKEGLYIQLEIKNDDGQLSLAVKEKARFDKKTVMTPFLNLCASIVQNTWMIDTNKCLDLPRKGIHSASPYCVGFKREALPPFSDSEIEQQIEKLIPTLSEKLTAEAKEKKIKELENVLATWGEKYKENVKLNKIQLSNRIDSYFVKALKFVDESTAKRLEVFKNGINSEEKIQHILRGTFDEYASLKDGEYVIFFLDALLSEIEKASNKYLGDGLFNTSKYNVVSEEDENVIYGTSGFFSGYNGDKPFLMHQTSSFEIAGRISNREAKALFDFKSIIDRKIFPNPLPIFIYEDEQKLSLPIMKSNAQEEPEKRLGFQAILKSIIEGKRKSDKETAVGNYYLLFFSNGEIKDYDFVSRFDYELNTNKEEDWVVKPLFGNPESFKPMTLTTVFDFQNQLLPKMLNNSLVVNTKGGVQLYKYFDDIDTKYCKNANTFLLAMKYRKALYDFVYKSQHQSFSQTAFEEIMMTLIIDDIRADRIEKNNHTEYFSVREKLNILFSLHSKFHPFLKKELFMANQIIELRAFVAKLAQKEASVENDAQFAFTTGQVIAYLFSKSESDDKSYNRLEPFLQQTDVKQLRQAIVKFFGRYKHKTFSRKFKTPFSEVMTYETSTNIRSLMPLVLAGFFSENLLFSDKTENNQESEK